MFNVKRLFSLLLALGLLGGAVFTIYVMAPVEPTISTRVKARMPVSIIQGVPAPFEPVLTFIGTTKPRWKTQIQAPAQAKVLTLDDTLEPGIQVNKNQTMATLDTTHLEHQYAQAESELHAAELELERQQHEQTVALKMLKNKASSAYARKEPQITAAKAQVEHSKKAVHSAKKRLNDATIQAPFDAILLSRLVSPGQEVEESQPLFEIAASDSIDIQVPIAESKWQQVIAGLPAGQVRIRDSHQQLWQAKLRYVAPQADPQTRQRQIILYVEKPYDSLPRLLPHQQVRVDVVLSPLPFVLKVPNSALTRDGLVWTLDNEDKIFQEPVSLLKQDIKHSWVAFTENAHMERRVVAYPLISMLPGQHVLPEVLPKEAWQ